MAPFEEAFVILIEHEKGYVDDPNDRGGETKYGISRNRYPDEDIRNLTLERAKFLYKRDYWDKCLCDKMAWPISLLVFDAAVNSGDPYGRKLLQRALGVTPGGVLGPVTMRVLKERSIAPWALASEMNALRMFDMTKFGTWQHHGLGWTRRMMNLCFQACGKLA